ncbi:MAG: DNA gyrase inhibitor YacG [Rhodopirellula sp. JB055]|uniref:DNA gyrase inhibitor YacG n=1 Tax=Rhodopirellula sp. JB055 TaxID=3342846 RepID=UPI00370C0148
MQPPVQVNCPTCSRRFLSDETPAMPFCSKRCQLIDLGRWMNEEIGLPHEGDPGDTPVEYLDDRDPTQSRPERHGERSYRLED